MRQTDFARFNDGVAYIYREVKKQTDFNAKINVRKLNDLEYVCKLAFEEMNKRQQDVEFANQNGYSLSLKIHTRFLQDVTTKFKVVINGYLYDIYDMDKTKTDMYLYLQEVRKLDT